MEEKTATTEGATETSVRIHLETIYSPSVWAVWAAEATEAERRQGARPKDLAPWPAAQPDPSLWGKAAGAVLTQEIGQDDTAWTPDGSQLNGAFPGP